MIQVGDYVRWKPKANPPAYDKAVNRPTKAVEVYWLNDTVKIFFPDVYPEYGGTYIITSEVELDLNCYCQCGSAKCGSPMHSPWCPVASVI